MLTDEDGTFEFPRSSGQCSVGATSQAHASNYMSQTTIAGNPPPTVLPIGVNLAEQGEPIELTLQESDSITLSGVARWENGEPVVNLEVKCGCSLKLDGKSVGVDFTRIKTDEQGRYSITAPAALDQLVLYTSGTRNSEGVWLPAHGDCKNAKYLGSQIMEFDSLTEDIATANWVLKPWPNQKEESRVEQKLKRELSALIAKKEALFNQYVEAKNNGGEDLDPDYSLDPRASMAYEFLTFEREYRGEDVALQALKIVLQTARELYKPDAGSRARREAVDRLIGDYLKHKDLADTFPLLGDESAVPNSTRLLTKAVLNSPYPEVQAAALISKILRAQETRRYKSLLQDMEKYASTLSEMEQQGRFMILNPSRSSASLKRRITYLKEIDSEALKKEANQWIDQLVRDYSNTPNPKTKSKLSFGETAALLRTSINDIEIGKPVPDLAATDINGKPFRLSEMRGKVVILSFAYSLRDSVGILVRGDIRRARDKYADAGVEVVSVVSVPDNQTDELIAAVKADHPDGTFIAEPQRYGPLRWQWGGEGTGIFVINRQGVLVHCGELLSSIDEVVKRALDSNKKEL